MTWYIDILLYFWLLFKEWINTLFVAPFQHGDMLWLLIPIWATWFFAEFFQEKQGTSMGNAITNSVVVIWGSIDCTRQTVNLISAGTLVGFGSIFVRFLIIGIILAYGVTIVVLGLKGNRVVKYIGRVREVTYAFAMFAPVLYGAVELDMNHVISVILFFPLFYFAIELLDRYTPNPKAVTEDLSEKKGGSDFGSDSLSSSGSSGSSGFGSDPLGSGSSSKDSGLGDLKL